jgi:phospholipid/cholesterol/gamma-HCH transport system ATP-binding protein
MRKNIAASVSNLTVKYNDDLILDNISFSVAQNEIFVILGGSGSGKSTLLRHMVGLENPLSGQVFIDDINITECAEKQFYTALNKIGVLFQSSALISSMTVGENVALPIAEFTNFSKKSIEKMVHVKLSLVGLENYENYLPSEISGGMKKRAGLARALALNPAILFLDEPSAGLDPVTAAEIDELILDINKKLGTTIIIVTHELASIFAVAKRVIMLDKSTKSIIAEGTPDELKNNCDNPYVCKFFNRRTNNTNTDLININT